MEDRMAWCLNPFQKKHVQHKDYKIDFVDCTIRPKNHLQLNMYSVVLSNSILMQAMKVLH